eukprot:scaffold34603_cov212-Amphora_coffeaeformis.AAC.10
MLAGYSDQGSDEDGDELWCSRTRFTSSTNDCVEMTAHLNCYSTWRCLAAVCPPVPTLSDDDH